MQKTVLVSVEELEQNFKSWINECLKEHTVQPIIKEHEIEKPKPVKEAAAFLNLTVPTMYGLTSKNKITFHKKGKKIYFYEADLIAYIKSGRQKSVDEIKRTSEEHLGRLGESKKKTNINVSPSEL